MQSDPPINILLVERQDFRTSDDDPVMGVQEIFYCDRNIKFHHDRVAWRPGAVEYEVPVCCQIGKDRLPIKV